MPKLTAIPQDLVEVQRPEFFLVPHQVQNTSYEEDKNTSNEEESTTCSGSDLEPLSSSNSESDGSPVHHPGLQPPPGIPSFGSALHGTGMCQPCLWFWKPRGCTSQGSCQYCHLCPNGEIKERKKAKALRKCLGITLPKKYGASESGAQKHIPK